MKGYDGVLRIEPLGTQIVLPAFIVGYELHGESECIIDEFDDVPAWLMAIDQQAGGYCMTYPSVLGAILRFADNSQHCHSDVATVTRGFQAMAEDPELGLLRREFPDLANLVYTRGEEYDRDELRRLQRFIERFFNIPQIESGIEGFVRMACCDPMAYFAGWKMVKATPKFESRQLYRDCKSICIDESSIGSLEFSVEEFGKEPISIIREFGHRLRMDDVRVFLLWENSD